VLKFGDLAPQSVDFREQHCHMFGLDFLGRPDPFSAPPVPETAPIRAEPLIGSGRDVRVATVLADVLARGQLLLERGW
jgi:hypothetical protein